MALCNSKSSTQFQIQQSQQILFVNFFRLSIFLFLHFPFTNSFSFNFPGFQTSGSNITYEGDAYQADGAIQVTMNIEFSANSTESVGRAYYSMPIHLWDSDTGNFRDFNTHFSFNMTAGLNAYAGKYGDGLTFFLSPPIAELPKYSGGGYLGLFENSTTALNGIDNHIVAVEFDTATNAMGLNPWDQRIDRVCIDVSSTQSVCNSSFPNSNSTANVWVNYDSSTMTLSVYLTYEENPVFQGNSVLSHVVNLTEVLPEWVNVGFSAATGYSCEMYSILSWTFESTLGRSYNSTLTSNTTLPVSSSNSTLTSNSTLPASSSNSSSRGSISTGTGQKMNLRLSVGLAVIISIGALSCGVGLFWFMKTRKTILREKNNMGVDASTDHTDVGLDASTDHTEVGLDASTHDTDEFEKGTGPRRFTSGELSQATNNFSEARKLGEGGFGAVYRGVLGEIQEEIAVKRISKTSRQGRKEYKSEVKVISRLRHVNLVELIGWCHEQGDLLIVYNFMPNGSLDTHLFGGKSKLSWTLRYKIALGLASAVLYLHEQCEKYVIHRDIKSSNVMLDANYTAKLGDFGLARLVDHEFNLEATALAGTMGYLAPECFVTGKTNKESDVYSFGVVALEIACGRKPIYPNGLTSGHRTLPEWVWGLYGERQLFEAVDKALAREYNQSQVKQLMLVGLSCCHPNPYLRPSISEVFNILSFRAQLPALPSQMPKQGYSSTPTCKPSYPSSVATTDSHKDTIPYWHSSDGPSLSPKALLQPGSPSIY